MVSGAGLIPGWLIPLGFPAPHYLSKQSDQRQISQTPKHGSLAGVNVLAMASVQTLTNFQLCGNQKAPQGMLRRKQERKIRYLNQDTQHLSPLMSGNDWLNSLEAGRGNVNPNDCTKGFISQDPKDGI